MYLDTQFFCGSTASSSDIFFWEKTTKFRKLGGDIARALWAAGIHRNFNPPNAVKEPLCGEINGIDSLEILAHVCSTKPPAFAIQRNPHDLVDGT